MKKKKTHICSVWYQYRVKRERGVISEGILDNFKTMKILGLIFLIKDQILMPLSGLAPSKLKFFQQKLRVGHVYINESFDIIFNMDF